MSFSLEDRAREFASNAHGAIDQRRKWTNAPYIEHPLAVAEIVRSVPHDERMLAAALLHDVVEDTPATFADIREAFGFDVETLVFWLTNPTAPREGDRAARKALYHAHSAAAPQRAQTIKMADVIDNTRNVADLNPEFARIYLPEKAALIDMLTKADPHLVALAKAQVGAYV